MPRSDQISRQRTVLFSARLRFAPEAQPIREQALDGLIEQTLLLLGGNDDHSVDDILARVRQELPGDSVGPPHEAVLDGLRRLVGRGRLELRGSRYVLAAPTRASLEQTQREAEGRLDRVASILFEDVENGQAYRDPFLQAIGIIFGRLGDEYAREIRGEGRVAARLSGARIVSTAARASLRNVPGLDPLVLARVLGEFIEAADPDSNYIKWNLAQNYYLSRALGLDPSGALLSSEVFGGAILYLDTNVVVHAVEPLASLHTRFRVLSDACRTLGIQFRFCQISVDELRRVVAFHRVLIERVAGQIPEETVSRVTSIFFQLYVRAGRPTGAALAELFAAFESPGPLLRDRYGAELIDDAWFTEAEFSDETTTIVELIRAESLTRRRREKGFAAALHDAELLQWIDKEREVNPNTWIVTLDTVLPVFAPRGAGRASRPRAITLDALLQWVTPLAVTEEGEGEVAAIYSEALRQQLLPRDLMFKLSDFVIFSDLALSCRELPAEDVEKCIQHLKHLPGSLNPAKAEDREKIALEIARFFADPGRKYRREVERLEKLLDTTKADRDQALSAERSQFLREQEQRESKIAAAHAGELAERDQRLSRMEADLGSIREQTETDRVRRKRRGAYARLALGLIFAAALIGGSCMILARWGEGSTAFQRVVKGWSVVIFALAVGGTAIYMLLGKERLALLSEPLRRLFRKD